ncbi:hypothetical protein OG21DRAFT_1491871, partial [Imleria badia]
MPQAKTTRGQLKTVSCPRCSKKFCTETNVLQHMNQPTGSCYGSLPLYDEGGILDAQPFEHDAPSSHSVDQPELPPEGTSVNEDIEMNEPEVPLNPSSDPPVFEPSRPGSGQLRPGRYIETFEGSMWREHFLPWASKEEWAFASWLLHSRLSIAAIDSLLLLDIIKSASLSFRSAKELRARAEILPPGPKWVFQTLQPEYSVKQLLHLFHHNPIDCLQALLSHPLFADHISFVPRKVWTCTVKLCRVYDKWLSGDRAWSIQEALPPGATLLGVVLSSDKMNISVMSGNRVAHPVLISLANIDTDIRSKTSLHAYLLLTLLPVAKFAHKISRVRGLLQDRLVHQALNIVLMPLKVAARVGVMMSDPVGNLRYCFTPLAAWIADTPEESMLSATGSKVSPVTTATSKNFGDPYRHPPRTADKTLVAIRTACSQHSPRDYKKFLKAIKPLGLNGVVEPVWIDWLLSDPSRFLLIEPLHHFHRFAWDHDVQWCLTALGADELDFRFSIIQTLVGYRAFNEGLSKLKQVTGHDHRAVQRYIIGVVAGGVPRNFLIAIRALLDFHYLTQAPMFTTDSLDRVTQALHEFHDHKSAIIHQGIRDSGAPMQWSADVTEHPHVDKIKVPACAGNNQNYYNQISRYLDQLDKCFRFDLATYIEECHSIVPPLDEVEDCEEAHKPDAENLSMSAYITPTRPVVDYFSILSALLERSDRNVPKPPRTFTTPTTVFHLATKPSSHLFLTEAADKYNLPNLIPAVCAFVAQWNGTSVAPDAIKLQ